MKYFDTKRKQASKQAILPASHSDNSHTDQTDRLFRLTLKLFGAHGVFEAQAVEVPCRCTTHRQTVLQIVVTTSQPRSRRWRSSQNLAPTQLLLAPLRIIVSRSSRHYYCPGIDKFESCKFRKARINSRPLSFCCSPNQPASARVAETRKWRAFFCCLVAG